MQFLRSLIFGLVLSTPALAQTGLTFSTSSNDSDAPVEVTSLELKVERETGVALFIGNVRASQDKLKLAGDQVRVTYDEIAKKVILMVADGNVIFVTETEDAEAQHAVYDLKRNHLKMWGDVLVLQGSTAIAGDTLNVDLETGRADVTGNVRTVFGSK